MTYTAHRDTQQTLAILDTLDIDADKLNAEDLARKFGWEEDYHRGKTIYHVGAQRPVSISEGKLPLNVKY